VFFIFVFSTFQQSYEALPTEQKATLLFSSLPAASGIGDDGRQLAAVMLRRLLTSEFQVHANPL
jgi:hypothetical protein